MTFRTASTGTIVRLATAGLAAAAVLTGCTFTNPATIATPYAASDGTASSIQDPATGGVVNLRNFLVATSKAGAAGVVAGAIAVDGGSAPITVSLTVQDATGRPVGRPVQVKVTPGTLAEVGPGGTNLTLPTVPTGPGTNLQLQASTPAGSTVFPLPVLTAAGPYATLTPTAAPTPAG